MPSCQPVLLSYCECKRKAYCFSLSPICSFASQEAKSCFCHLAVTTIPQWRAGKWELPLFPQSSIEVANGQPYTIIVLIALGSVFFPCPFRPDGGRSKRANAHILLLMASMVRHFEAESASHICQRRFCLRLSPFSLSSSMVLPRLALSARGCGGQPHAIFFLRKRCEGGCTLDGWEVQPQLVGCFEKVLRQGRLDDVLLVGVNERDLSCMQV